MEYTRHTRARRRRRLGAIEREMLTELSAGDLFVGYLLSAGSIRRMYKVARDNAAYRYRRKQAMERLLEDNFVRRAGKRLSITSDGRNALGDIVRETHALLRTKRWDGKWRIVIFDIPERYRELRDKVRYALKKAGFAQLQQSVWIFPHECKELIQLIQKESQLSKYILYGVMERVEGERTFRKLFKLR
ncbi:CRISPR-associated endonuclease Cas2 [Candidatus Kaiserbacteria bacterium CG10_big_fil_rev_8_21_14_0_10_59_10]|uniref:CRISPR-associated endonuclease Cas2 n=1 Tax=Candidatus Kaiserbacteria bacterium CG10_big_fil_rev_8_21_14_0_10_59_10 TaxID=1974612 RepID=A0A2H0U8D6_9BACT|nr:MAG: CRISPR-associated endonuclease Cas2 [Candidatus Kaiserbacteria bacterium CG10_big_fil_rev_8_21_14_0_10_59_10]